MTEPKRTRHRGPPGPSNAPAPSAAPAVAPLAVSPGATLADYALEWLKLRDKRTRAADGDRLRDHALPLIGNLRLQKIEPAHLADVVRRTLAKKGMTVKSARNAYAVLADLIGDALTRGFIESDPRDLPADLWPEEETVRPTFSPDEVLALTTDERLAEPQRMYHRVAFGTGLSSSELCQLTFNNWRERLEAPASAELEAQVEAWRTQGFERSYGRPPTADDPLLPRSAGTPEPHSEGSAFKAFRRACVTLGIKTRSPLAIRYTHEARREQPAPPSAS